MPQNKFNKWLLVLLSSIFLLPLLHLFDSYTIPQRVHKLTRDTEILSSSYDLYLDISAMISNTRAYVLYSEEKYVERFHIISTRLTKKEINLYNMVDSSEKEIISELMISSKKYVSLVEEDIITAVQQGDKKTIELLKNRHEFLSSELKEKISSVRQLRQEELDKDLSTIISLQATKRTLSIITIFTSLLLLLIGTRKFLWPLLTEFSRMDQLTTQLKNPVVITTSKGYVTKINKAAQDLLSTPAEEVEGKTLNEAVSNFPYTQSIIQPLFNVILDGEDINAYQTFYSRSGHKTLLTVDYIPFSLYNRPAGAAMIAQPSEIRRDKSFLFEAIESERKKISIEIHDWIGRNMSPIIHSLDYILNVGAESIPPHTNDQLVQLRKHCQNAANDMRSIMNDIHPYLIDKVGLLSALESYARNFEQTHGVKIYLFYQDRPLDLSKTAQIVIYRIAQESLTNVTKHSNANEVDIFFTQEDHLLKIEIVDNGDIPHSEGGGKGLWGMKERANLIGGDLVYGFTESGFAVTLTIPLLKEGQTGGQD